AILFYDFSLTFSTEVEYFWKSANISLFSVLFAANRYFGLLGPIPTIFEYFTSPSEQVIILVLRTYALYERSGRILVLLIVTHDVCLFTDLAIAWFAMLWFDTTIFVLTLARAIQMHRRLPGGIVEILFRDGTIYYGRACSVCICRLSTTLISRLILNLRDTRLRRARYIGEGANSQALSATSAQSVVSRVVFGRDQAKALSTSASDSTSCTDFPNDTEMTA
ncbi:hypothetical protein BD311DRAFT_647487, partial [Dichomitus squalens]